MTNVFLLLLNLSFFSGGVFHNVNVEEGLIFLSHKIHTIHKP